jgi:hypothetical protein
VVNITAGGTGNAITGTASPAIAAYTDMDTTPPMTVCFEATAVNTAGVTIALNGLTAKSLFKLAGAINTPLVAGDINAGQWVCAKRYVTGDAFQMITPTGNAAAGGGGLSLTTKGYCFLTNFCVPYSMSGAGAISSVNNKMYMQQILIPADVLVKNLRMYAASAATGSDYVGVGFWTDSSNTPGTFVANSQGTFNSWGSGYNQAAVNGGTGITLTAGVYWMGFATTTLTLQWYTRGGSLAVEGMLGNIPTTPRLVSCSNSASGTYTLPSTCGTATAEGSISVPWIISTP